jgi:hypothetical protein
MFDRKISAINILYLSIKGEKLLNKGQDIKLLSTKNTKMRLSFLRIQNIFRFFKRKKLYYQ